MLVKYLDFGGIYFHSIKLNVQIRGAQRFPETAVYRYLTVRYGNGFVFYALVAVTVGIADLWKYRSWYRFTKINRYPSQK